MQNIKENDLTEAKVMLTQEEMRKIRAKAKDAELSPEEYFTWILTRAIEKL